RSRRGRRRARGRSWGRRMLPETRRPGKHGDPPEQCRWNRGWRPPPLFRRRHPPALEFAEKIDPPMPGTDFAMGPGMQATSLTFTLTGLAAPPIQVEVAPGRGPVFSQLVGLAEASVRESRVRVRAALEQLGVPLAEYVITVNLSPADLKKSGGG